MENASKALIIAGAILIAILLISVGIIVMNNTNKPIDAAASQSDSQALEIYNAKFSAYIGADQSAQSVKSLLTVAAAASVNVYKDNDSGDATSTTNFTTSDIKTGSTYTVRPVYNTDGKITSLYVK